MQRNATSMQCRPDFSTFSTPFRQRNAIRQYVPTAYCCLLFAYCLPAAKATTICVYLDIYIWMYICGCVHMYASMCCRRLGKRKNLFIYIALQCTRSTTASDLMEFSLAATPKGGEERGREVRSFLSNYKDIGRN